nr:IgGFc-binding protein [Candidatus Kapabacteria bacterium]
ESTSQNNLLHLELFVTGNNDTKVKIEIAGLKYSEEFDIPGDTVIGIRLNPKAELLGSGTVDDLSVHVTSDLPISVYGLNRRHQTTDTYLGLPVNVLGYEYRAMCYIAAVQLMGQFAVIATENNTNVTITPTVNTKKFPGGISYTVRLKKGEVYQVQAKYESRSTCDLTGSLIKADKKIAVFSGHQCAYVPSSTIACNHLVEQLPPVTSWGKNFFLGKFKTRLNYTYRVLANEDDTRIFEDTTLVDVLKPGEYFEARRNKSLQISATKPVLVSQYSHGLSDGDSIGDPMMLLVSPTLQFLHKYRFATPIKGEWRHYINVVVPTSGIGSIKLDYVLLNRSMFKPLGISRYSIAYISIPYGSHVIEGDEPFGMYSYGFGYGKDAYDAYGNMGGQSFFEYEFIADTTPPYADAKKDTDFLSVIVRDDRLDDTGLRNISVLSQEGVIPNIPKIEGGMPQALLSFKAEDDGIAGRAVIEAFDVEGNNAVYTVCYSYNVDKDRFEYSLSEGLNDECAPDPGIQLGLFGKLSYNFHNAGFSSTADIAAQGEFGEDGSFGGFGGVYIGRRIGPEWVISARISFEDQHATLNAPDSMTSQIRFKGELVPFQESRTLELNGSFLNIAFAGEWYWKKSIYIKGGMNVCFNINDEIEYTKSIIRPGNFVYPNGKSTIKEPGYPETLSSLSGMKFGLFGGIGLNKRINQNFIAYAESYFTTYISSMIDDGDWALSQFSFNIGIKYIFQMN